MPANLASALAIAAVRLNGVDDKNGEPLLLHVCRVVERVRNYFGADTTGSEAPMIVAALHDVVEDGTGWDSREHAMEWLQARFSIAVVNAVSAITRRDGEEYLSDYIARVCANRLASMVKLADLDDNLGRPVNGEDAERSASRTERYWKARRLISDALVKG